MNNKDFENIGFKIEGAKMALWVRALAAKLGDLSSLTETHTVKGEKQLLQVSSDLQHVLWHMHAHIHKVNTRTYF